MAHADFVHLRVRTAYSLLEGAVRLEGLVETCRDWRMPAVSIADRGNMFGVLAFSEACSKAGVQPIIGCDLAIGTRGDQPGQQGRAVSWLLLLAQDETGYRNLMALTSEAFIQGGAGGQPLVTLDELAARADGLLALTGGPAGPVGRLLLDGQLKAARELMARLGEIFPDRLYVELMRHGLAEEEQIEGHLIALADELDLPLVATNDVYFLRAEMYEAHDALLCVAQNSHVEDENRRRLTPQHFFRPADEMRALFADLPEAVDNTVALARRCAVMAPERKPILPVFPTAADAGEAGALRTQAEEGLARRLEAEVYGEGMDEAAREAAAGSYRERLDYELGVIIEMQFAGYFLIVADIVRWARGEGIPVGPGRGSGAGSVAAWALTITDLDPLRFGLLFERFLNPERVSMPDFDIDFCPERRDEVIDYVCHRYGEDRVAQIITFGKLQARAVLRDVGRVLGLGYGRVDRLCKLVPYNPANPVTLQQALDSEPRLAAERDNDSAVARLIEISLQLEGLYRHASTHAAGIVIGDRPLSELVPLYRDPRSEMPATQFSMKYAEMSGLVKFDLLGLKTLTVLDHAGAILHEAGVEIDLAALPLDDAATYEMLGRGNAMGVFQLESAGMRDALRSLKPDSIEDIIALVALYRPGPMDNIPRYIACKHGREKPDHLHPMLTGILEETFGVIIYQEQVMEIAKVLANYSLGGADLLRRAMGKKIKSEMDAQRETFVKGALDNGVARADASRIFELVAKFAGYGFNKSHAAAYALVAYQTAYLKANHPVEFLAASMSLEINNTDRLELFRRELERLGILLLPPDINASRATFSVESQADGTKAIRYALGAIRNVGVQAMVALADERAENGPYRDAFDFASRNDPHQINRRLIENLAKAGAFDCLTTNRRQMAEGAEILHAFANAAQLSRTQTSLFDDGDASLAPRPSLPEQEDWDLNERLAAEQEAVGFYLSAHPLDSYAEALEGLSVTPSAQVAQQVATGITRFRLAGVVLSVRERGPGSQRYAFIQLSDPSGSFEVAAFRETYGDGRGVLEPGRAVLITAQARKEGDDVRLSAQGFDDLDARLARNLSGLAVHVRDTEALEPLAAILAKRQEGGGIIALFVETGDAGTVEIELPTAYAVSPSLSGEIGALSGVSDVRELPAARHAWPLSSGLDP